MEQRQNSHLRLGAQIDQQISAGDHVQAREWRVGEHVLDGEDHRRAQVGDDPVAVILLSEEARQTGGGNLVRDGVGIESFPGGRHGVRVEVGRE